MSRVLHVDGSQGASGDMILGALVDLGFPLSRLRKAVRGPGFAGLALRSRRMSRCGLIGTRVEVRVRGQESDHAHQESPAHHGRSRREILRLLAQADVSPPVRRRAREIFDRLLEAEGRVHGIAPERVHLHEAGMLDAIVDVLGAVMGLEYLGIERVIVAPLTTGWGQIRCAHGTYPVPAPAVMELMRGISLSAGEIEAERLTPTGAAILVVLADAWGQLPQLVPEKVGYGAGARDLVSTPNMLRMVLGHVAGQTAESSDPTSEIVVVECSIDDAVPQVVSFVAEQLRARGALDVQLTATTMKKGRIGQTVTVLARPDLLGSVVELLLRETPTLGVRYRTERRVELPRRLTSVATPHGKIRVKIAQLSDGEKIWPEYDDCAAAAKRRGVPLYEVQRAALHAAMALSTNSGRRGASLSIKKRTRKKR